MNYCDIVYLPAYYRAVFAQLLEVKQIVQKIEEILLLYSMSL